MLAELLTWRPAGPMPAALLCCKPRSTDALRSSARRDLAARSSGLLACAVAGSSGRARVALRLAELAHDGGPSEGTMLSERLREACNEPDIVSVAAPAGDSRGGYVIEVASGPFGLMESCVAGASLRLEDANALNGVGCGSMGPIAALSDSTDAREACGLLSSWSAPAPPAS